jgi:hypothetical protein
MIQILVTVVVADWDNPAPIDPNSLPKDARSARLDPKPIKIDPRAVDPKTGQCIKFDPKDPATVVSAV